MQVTSTKTKNLTNDAAPERSIRDRILDAAVQSLIEQGAARTTTLEVQRKAEVSRGALLHHFPTHAELLSATVTDLVRRNEQSVFELLDKLQSAPDAVERAIRALALMMAQPPFMAELELWTLARTDEGLREALLKVERDARKESERVLRALFAPVADRPGHDAVIAMTTDFLRGFVLSGVLRRNPVRRQQMISNWVRATQILLAHWK
ncbi:TetR family transcriptional regulator [Acidovorax sp. Root267]|jgi:AcrR family transcriptional regulator|uniref:TetR/AcrR family transcriptional regulator n=1 Tax=Acidovorax sp. Root267 TaxID=1736505 RepID=UPI00070D859A|nr:TetR/AcrR family transcriptional regulator [Acidovorax sp. Root267]KRD26495.1 TetR family transcriptional regulator [Acidovorax sp. Root267]